MSFKFSKLPRTVIAASLLLAGLASPGHVMAQEEPDILKQAPDKVLEEIIVEGRKSFEGHDGMEAFWSGDFEKAEIEFEREFKTLKRGKSSLYNVGVDADLGIERANNIGASIGAQTQITRSGSSTASIQNNSAGTNTSSLGRNFNGKRAIGKNLLNDGKITDMDFAFTKYMSGLSELQLGKYVEAKKSLKSAVFYNRQNFDARMRLGLLYVIEGDIEKSADQLEALENIRVKCKKKSNCAEYDEILEAASTLATSISNAINKLD